jgi:hypothetical protein
VRAAPAVSCAVARMKTRTRAYRFSGSIPAFPAQWPYGLLRALPSERLFCHCRPKEASLLEDLTPAPRRQDHTTSPYAQAALVSRSSRVHRISPRVRDDGQRPSSAVRRADSITDLPDGASGIFLCDGMDRLLRDLPVVLKCRTRPPQKSLQAERRNPQPGSWPRNLRQSRLFEAGQAGEWQWDWHPTRSSGAAANGA